MVTEKHASSTTIEVEANYKTSLDVSLSDVSPSINEEIVNMDQIPNSMRLYGPWIIVKKRGTKDQANR